MKRKHVWAFVIALVAIAAKPKAQISSQFVRYIQIWDSLKFKNSAVTITGLSNDTTLSANSSSILPTQMAVKKYVDFKAFTIDTSKRFGGVKTIYRAYMDSIALANAIAAKGTVSSFSMSSANGFNSIVSNPTTTPSLTLSVASTSNLFKGNGSGGIIAATPGTDYVTPTGLTNQISSISLNTSGVLHNSPVTFTNNGSGGWSGTLSLANQSAYTLLGRGAGSGTPSFLFIDTNYFNGRWAAFVSAVAPTYTNGRGLTLSSNTFRLDTTGNYTWTGLNTFNNADFRIVNSSSAKFRLGGSTQGYLSIEASTSDFGIYRLFNDFTYYPGQYILKELFDTYTELNVLRSGELRFRMNGSIVGRYFNSTGNFGLGVSSDQTNCILQMPTYSSGGKAILLPRMTKTVRDAIVSPIAGMMIYQTDNTPGLRVYNGTNWMRYTETAD